MSKQEGTSRHIPLFYHVIIPILLTCATIITYYPSLHYNFQFDDIANIQKHFFIRYHTFSKLFFSGSRWISYWLNALHYSIGKFDPFSFRMGNLIIHSVNGILIFFFILCALAHCQSTPFFKRNASIIAMLTSMLFLLHPVQTQTVSYVIQGQLEGLACMFIVAMALTFLHFCYNACKIKRSILFALLIALAAISCGTKEIAFISPFLIICVDWFFVAHGSWKSFKTRLWIHALLFFVITSIYVYFLKPEFFMNILGLKMSAKNNIGNIITQQPSQEIGPWIFLISQFKVILHYIWIFIWPFNISVEYDWVLVRSFFSWDCFLPFVTLIALGASIIRILLNQPTQPLCFGAFWFFICIAPRSSIIPSPELLVDYKTYTASIGWLFIIASVLVAGIQHATHKLIVEKNSMRNHQTQLLLASLLIMPLCFFTWQRNLVWSSGERFWRAIIEASPWKARAYNNYGVELSQNLQRYQEAIPYFKKSAQMDPHYPDPYNNLAVCYSYLNQIDKAIESLQQGLRINKAYPQGHNNLGSFYLQQGKYQEAEQCFKTALQLSPNYGKAYFNLGRLHATLGNQKESLEYFKKACTIADLDNQMGFKMYAQAAVYQKEYDQAIWAFQKAIECAPDDQECLFGLANCYFVTTQYDKSLHIYQQMITHNPADIRAWYNLGESLFMLGETQKAYECFKHIEHHWEQIPQIRIRLASCYEKMHDPYRAHQELMALCNARQTPAQFKIQAKELMAKLEDHYPQIQAIARVV